MKDNLCQAKHPQAKTIRDRHDSVIRRCVLGESMYYRHIMLCYHVFRWEKLRKDSGAHKARLQRSLDQFKKVCDIHHMTYYTSVLDESYICNNHAVEVIPPPPSKKPISFLFLTFSYNCATP